MIKVGIIGLGLIGTSILKKLSLFKDKYEIFCSSKSSFEKALKYTPYTGFDIKIVKDCDIIFVCSKISKTLDILEELNSFLPEKAIVADVSSIKTPFLNKKFSFDFILSHPMAGTEKSGFEAGEENLFQGAKWLIEKNNPLLEEIILNLGAIPLKINMKDHDFLCAQISHLPLLLSILLFQSALDEAKQIASSGFRDTTRLAISSSDLTMGIFKGNKENILKAFDLLIEKFNDLKKLSDDEKIKLFSEISKNRKEMYNENGKNIFKI